MANSDDFNIVDALSGDMPVMLIHAVNGGYLKPDYPDYNLHVGEARTQLDLDDATLKAKAHLWYLTPYRFIAEREKMTYFIETAASEEVPPEDDNTDRRRRITVTDGHAGGVMVGKIDSTPSHTLEKQLWFVTLAECCGGLTFVPITYPGTIFGNINNTVNPLDCGRPARNPSGWFEGFLGSTFFPRKHKHREPVHISRNT